MAAVSNSTLSLYHNCPPGIGGEGCQSATCNSTFVDPSTRVIKPDSAKTCSSCDDGFSGLNCNICKGRNSCYSRQQALGRGNSGVASSGLTSVNNTLTCDNQPKAITQNNVQCTINQPTLAALFPGQITLTAIKVANIPDWTSTGLSEWNANGNSSYSQVFLDGVEQFYCQSTQCTSSNTTTPVGSAAQFGTENWSCGTLQCFCIPGTTLCSNSAIPLASIIDGISGTLDFPCDYVDPNDATATTSCAFKNTLMDQFLGPSGLPLEDCTFGQCLSQYDLDQDWAASSQASANAQGSHLSGGVIAGLAILGVAVAILFAVLAWGYILLRAARRSPRVYDEKAVGLAWENVRYEVKSDRLGPTTLLKRRHKRRQSIENEDVPELNADDQIEGSDVSSFVTNRGNVILDNITSKAAPGCLTIILGASGAGKSSLVDILAGRHKAGLIQGRLSYLAEEQIRVQSGKARRRIAVVDQDDSVCLPSYMTVRESLLFAAELSNPESVPHSEGVNLVDTILETLGLQHIANSRIGDARKRGISGGERRRVSLGIALVARPKILILDEPTSGLDAYSAHRVITALRKLASGPESGTTIIATLHQPSSEVFQMADNAVLLDRGSVVFEGRPSDAVEFCQSNGTPVPVGYNVADSLLSLAFQRRANASKQGEKSRQQSSEESKSDSGLVMTSLALHHGGDQPITTFMTQLHALLYRNWIMIRRDLSGPVTHIIGAIVISIFVGGCFYQVGLNIAGFQNRVGSIFFLFILILFSSLSALTGIAKERLLMMRERANGFYSPWSWLTSHLVYDLGLLRLIPAICMTCIIYFMVGLNSDAGLFFQFLLVTIIFNWVASVYQMLLSALLEDTSTAILYGGLFILFNFAFAGFVLNLDNIPPVIRWLQWICPAKYALEAVATEQLKNLELIDTIGGVPISTSVSLFAFKLFAFQVNTYYRDLIILACGFLVGFSVLLFAAVYWRMRERR